MEQAVRDCRGQGRFIVKGLGPGFVGLVDGEDRGALLVAAADDLEEQVRSEFVNREIADLVQNKDAGREVFFEFGFESVGALRGAES